MKYAKNAVAWVLIGTPGSGKSTWTRDYQTVDCIFEGREPAMVLSTDDFIEALAAKEGKTYSEIWNNGTYAEAEKQMRQDLQFAMTANKDIIWDQTNLKRTKRMQIVSDLNAFFYEVRAVVFTCDWETTVARAEARKATGKIIPLSIIENMRNVMDPVAADEGFDEIIEIRT